MQPYNVEIFDRNFNFIHNYTIESIDYQEDYLTLPETVVFMSYNENVKRGNYITVFNDLERYSGIITSVVASAKYDGFMNVGFKSLLSYFNASFALSVSNITNYAKTHSLENLLYTYIKLFYVDGNIGDGIDTDLKVPGLSISVITNTYNWNIGLYNQMQDDFDGYQKVSLIDDLIVAAMKLYKIGCYVNFNFKTQTITIEIGIKTNTPITVETDLPNIYNVAYNKKQSSNDVNTVDAILQNESSHGEPQILVTQYKHYDGTWSDSKTDRILPPIYDQMFFTYADLDTGKRNQDVNQMLVANYGGSDENDNMIEIVVDNNDPLATSFALGDEADIIINDTVYRSIYTGKTKKKTTTLIFGTQRIDLTKQLIRRI